MKTLGIDIISNAICLIGLDGTKSGGQVFFISRNKVEFPSSAATEFDNLIQLKDMAIAMLKLQSIDAIGIVKSTIGCTPIRIKCEFIVEMACSELGISCKLVSPQTVAAAGKRKISAETGSTFEAAFNKGLAVQPKYLSRAAICAWCVLI